MTTDKIKKIIFNPELVFFQTLIPVYALSEMFWLARFITSTLFNCNSVESSIKILFYLFLLIYPFISVAWVMANYLYCKKNKTIRELTINSLISGITFSTVCLGCLIMYIDITNSYI